MTKEIKQLEVGYDEQVQELQIELSTWRKQNDILLKQMKEREDKFEDFTKELKEQKSTEIQQLKLELKQTRQEYGEKKNFKNKKYHWLKKN